MLTNVFISLIMNTSTTQWRKKMSKEVANTILQQLGGRRLSVMTGAKNFMSHNDLCGGLSFRIPQIAGIVNYVKIILNGSDLYNVEFGRIRGNDYKVLSSFEDIYAEDLIELFEKETGLYAHL